MDGPTQVYGERVTSLNILESLAYTEWLQARVVLDETQQRWNEENCDKQNAFLKPCKHLGTFLNKEIQGLLMHAIWIAEGIGFCLSHYVKLTFFVLLRQSQRNCSSQHIREDILTPVALGKFFKLQIDAVNM